MRKIIVVFSCGLSFSSYAALEQLSDDSMAEIQGQAGITIEQSQLLSIGELQYTDDGNNLTAENVRLSSSIDVNQASATTYTVDVTNQGALNLQANVQPSRLEIGGLHFGNSAASAGQFALDFQGTTNVLIEGKDGGGFQGRFQTGISDAELVWTTNGHSIAFENIGYNASVDNLTLDVGAAGKENALIFGLDNFAFSFSTGALRLGNTRLGELAGDLALSGSADVYGGGRSGEGFRVDSQINILSNPANFVRFTTEGNSLLLGNFSGLLNTSNLTFDVESDHLALQVDRLDAEFNAGTILIGDSTRPLGSVELDFSLVSTDTDVNRVRLYSGTRQPVFNTLPLAIRSQAQDFYSGLNAQSEGISAEVSWNLTGDAGTDGLTGADFSYIDDGRRVVISGIESVGSGNTTFDVRDGKVGIGISNLRGSYSIDGLRIGNENAPIQGGAELLLSLEVFQAMDFEINGFTEVTARPAGGISIDGDYLFTNTNIGLSVDENGEGVWATDVTYDLHLRDITFNVADDGIDVRRGEQWSTMDIGNLRWGDRNTGRSLGRIVLSRFEQDSSLKLTPGGAGAVCVGGTLNGAGTGCTGNVGRFEDRGNQGIGIALTAKFADAEFNADGSLRRGNRLIWENNRTVDAGGNPVNGTGTQFILEDFSTNDGLGSGSSNDYGFRANLDIDVFETRVLKKTDGPDNQGVNGNRGDELIYTSDSRDSYTYVANPTAAQIARRPLGFAVQGNVSFKELNIDSVQLKHPDVQAPQPVFYGTVIQNLNVTTNLTATPIQ